jgi:hypothetical protein
VALAGLAVGLGPPRFTWGNAGLEIRHPPTQGMAALAGATALALAVTGLRPLRLRLAGGAAAAFLLALGAERLAWRLDAIEAGLVQQSLLGRTRLAWADVERVDYRRSGLVVTGRNGTRLSVPTSGFLPEDRARLERTVTRRIRETSFAVAPTPAPDSPR